MTSMKMFLVFPDNPPKSLQIRLPIIRRNGAYEDELLLLVAAERPDERMADSDEIRDALRWALEAEWKVCLRTTAVDCHNKKEDIIVPRETLVDFLEGKTIGFSDPVFTALRAVAFANKFAQKWREIMRVCNT